MATEVEVPVEELIYQLFQHFGIQQAHIAASMPGDWMGFAASHPECISSLTLGERNFPDFLFLAQSCQQVHHG